MAVIDDQSFIIKLCGNKEAADCNVMPLDKINKQISDYIPAFTKRGTEIDEFTILGVLEVKDIEGIVKEITLDILPPGLKDLTRRRKHIVISDVLPRVVTPVILKIQNEVYMLLTMQRRVTLGGKATIEVVRGSVDRNSTQNRLGESLINKKFINISDMFDLVQIRDLGGFWNNPGNSGTNTPVQALFYVAKHELTIDEVKQNIKMNTKYDADPISGPPLPLISPVIKPFTEVQARISEIASTNTKEEAYLNDAFSLASLLLLFKSLEQESLPF